jgi:hypothetical protein
MKYYMARFPRRILSKDLVFVLEIANLNTITHAANTATVATGAKPIGNSGTIVGGTVRFGLVVLSKMASAKLLGAQFSDPHG